MKRSASIRGIRGLVFFWMGVLVLCFVVMAVGIFVETNELQRMVSKVFLDAAGLEAATGLEIAILGERREDLLWRETGKSAHRRRKERELQGAEGFMESLERIGSLQEEPSFHRFRREFARFREGARSDPGLPLEQISALTDDLLEALDGVRGAYRRQMTETTLASRRLNRTVDLASLGLVLLVTVLGAVGSLVLIHRILQPVLALIEAAGRFGQGDFSARVPVARSDEMGMLARTFNRMVESLTRLQQERLNFVASVAHDLKNPLLVVGAAARRLKKAGPPAGDPWKWHDLIIERVEYLEGLIQDLLESIQIETGQLVLDTEEVDLTALARETHRTQHEVMSSHRLRFREGEACRVLGDPRRLERVLSNLISNAVKYSPPGSEIDLEVERRDGRAVLTVRDQGVGISKEDLKALFEPFHRLDPTAAMAKGTGLGLFCVRRIVESLDGSIHIASEPGKGTRVEVSLPLLDASCGPG